MAWISKQPRLTQIYVFVAAQLNDLGIQPNGAVVKPWIREELEKHKIVADEQEITLVLTGLLKEGALTERDIQRVREAHAKVRGA